MASHRFFQEADEGLSSKPIRWASGIWVRILQESEKLSQTIQKLNQVIEESKQVDIEIEEKKREKAKWKVPRYQKVLVVDDDRIF